MPAAAADTHFAVWPTAWGRMGAVAGERGIRRVVLPHYLPDELVDLLAWEHPTAVRDERPFEQLISLTRAYFNARVVDFGAVACDLPAPGSFSGKVYRACREIPYGRTLSYSELAGRVGREDAARAVAAAMGRNSTPLIVPCHRVIYADGRAGGFSAAGGEALKRRLLDLERRGADA
jgi:methylated-DNA-[protein]-cysteine S-methyltransferase